MPTLNDIALPFQWDPRVQRLRDARGRFIARSTITQAFDATIANANAEIDRLSERLRNGSISIPTWQRQMAQIQKDLQVAAAGVARGGFSNITQADREILSDVLRFNLERLQRFAEQIDEEEIPLDGRFARRARLYGQSARSTLMQVERRKFAELGFTQERNILNAQESCRSRGDTSGCVEQSQKGWVEIGELVPIGRRTCQQSCKCGIEFRNPETGETVKWTG